MGSGMGMGMPTATEETVRATGLHIVFTQPVNQSGVPSQAVEHIIGEVFVDSLAVPAPPLPDLDASSLSSSSSSASSSSSSCLGGGHSGASTSGSGSAAGGSMAGAAGSSAGSAFGSGGQPTSGSSGGSLPAMFASALRKPLWLLLTYLVWQALVIGTGVSMWNWRREEAP